MIESVHRMPIVAVLLASALTACGGARPGVPHVTPEEQPPPVATLQQPISKEFVLTPGDVLTIKFYNNPDLTEDVVVRPDGLISLQLIGDVEAAGRTPGDVAAELKRRYTGELSNPRVTVIVRTLAGRKVYVGGEVSKPGVVTLNGPETVAQAIQEAGGMLKTAHEKEVILIRQQPGGRPKGYAIDMRPVLYGDHPDNDVPLRPYDIVFVPRSKIANADLFVEQYIRELLPITPGFAFFP